MGHSIFGWSLPPGCTMNDIERAYGDQPLFDEIFEAQGNLTDEEKQTWRQIYDLDEPLFNLIVKAMEWAYDTGHKACMGEEEENKFYESQYRQQVKIPKLRAYFKNLRHKKEEQHGL